MIFQANSIRDIAKVVAAGFVMAVATGGVSSWATIKVLEERMSGLSSDVSDLSARVNRLDRKIERIRADLYTPHRSDF